MEDLYINEIGNFKVLETYIYFDGPQLFSCISGTDQHYLCYWADSDEAYLKWLYIPVSNQRYQEIRNGEISIREAIVNTEDKYLWKLLISINGEKSFATRVEVSDISAELIPPDYLKVEPIETPTNNKECKTKAEKYTKLFDRISEINNRSKKVSSEKQLLKIS